MAAVKVSIPMQKQILELHSQGMKARKIAKILKVGRNTIRRVIERGDLIAAGAIEPAWSKTIDWEKVRLEVSRGVQLNILAREHAGQTISYVQCWRQFRKTYPKIPAVTMRLTHVPGERCFFDYGDGIDIVCQDTGEVKSTSLMCGVPGPAMRVFGTATAVSTGAARVFSGAELTIDALLASACLPHLFQAVQIDGEHYWDGGYMGNPVLFPLFYQTDTRDVVVVKVNQIRRENVPTTPVEIADRVDEISFNSSLMREMRAVEFVSRQLTEGWLKPEYARRMRKVLVHLVRADAVMGTLPAATKISTDARFLTGLRDRGRASADEWLRDHHADLGVRGRVDLRRELLD